MPETQLENDDRFEATIATDVALSEQGGARTAAGESSDPAIEARAAQFEQNPAALTAAVNCLVGSTTGRVVGIHDSKAVVKTGGSGL